MSPSKPEHISWRGVHMATGRPNETWTLGLFCDPYAPSSKPAPPFPCFHHSSQGPHLASPKSLCPVLPGLLEAHGRGTQGRRGNRRSWQVHMPMLQPPLCQAPVCSRNTSTLTHRREALPLWPLWLLLPRPRVTSTSTGSPMLTVSKPAWPRGMGGEMYPQGWRWRGSLGRV